MVMEIPKLEGLPSQPKPQGAQSAGASDNVAPTAKSSVGLTGTAPQGNAQPVDRAQVENLAQDLQKLAQNLHRELSFRVDDDTGKVVIRVIDADTEKVVRQIPSESVLALQQKLAELQVTGGGADASSMEGMLFNAET